MPPILSTMAAYSERLLLTAKNRSVYQRVVIACVLACVLLALTIAYAAHTLANEFDKIEINLAAQRADQMFAGFNSELQQMQVSLQNYAQWDEAYSYVQDDYVQDSSGLEGEAHFIQANFGFSTLKNLDVDMVWIGDSNGRQLYSGMLDNATNRVREPAPTAMTNLLNELPQHYIDIQKLLPGQRLLSTPSGIMGFAINQISRSDGSAPTPYWVVFGRFLQPGDITRIVDHSHFPVSMSALPLPAQHGLSNASGLAEFLASGQLTTAMYIDQGKIASLAQLRSYDGLPLAILHSEKRRAIAALGKQISLRLLGTIVALVMLFGATLVTLFLRLRRSFMERAAKDHRYQKITSQLQELLILVNADTLVVVELNVAAQTELGYDGAAYQALTLRDLLPELPITELPHAGRVQVTRRMETVLKRCVGAPLDVEISLNLVDNHEPQLICITARDISDKRHTEKLRREHQRRLIHIALHDSLTRLPNRMYLHSRLPQIIAKASVRSDYRLGLIYMDVDHFKRINDTYGHGSGDQLLRVIASRLRACVQRRDVVVRMGGDEFVIVAAADKDRSELEHLAKRVQAAVQAPIMVDGRDLSTSTSMGIAVYPEDGVDVETLLKNADIALYQAKEAGRRCHCFFSASMNAGASQNLALEQALRHAIGTDQISVVYQPVVSLHNGKLVSMEALARWRHPEQGMIPPATFIPLAEASGLIVELGEQVLTQVVLQLRTWLDAGITVTPVAVNVSALQLERTDFAHLAQRIAAASGLEMKWLRFEITESALLKDPEKLIGTLTTLRRMGSSILIDDFGTGYSSLNYLHRLPIDTVKIDRSFVSELEGTAGKSAVIEAVLEMAHKLQLTTVAEGIETFQQHKWLLEMGCAMGQGFHYSRPVNAQQCSVLLRSLGERKLTEAVVVRTLRQVI